MLLLSAALQAARINSDQLPFTDHCTSDPSFTEYRARLSAAVSQRNVSALRPLVAKDVRIGFGLENSDGWPAFVRTWALDRPAESQLWAELDKVLSLGCEEVGAQRYAPGNFTKLTGYNEPLLYVALTSGAPLRSQPDGGAPIIMMLDNHVLIDVGVAPEGWLSVRLTDGRSGYVRSAEARSAIDYRARFIRVEGRWVMAAFIAGD